MCYYLHRTSKVHGNIPRFRDVMPDEAGGYVDGEQAQAEEIEGNQTR